MNNWYSNNEYKSIYYLTNYDFNRDCIKKRNPPESNFARYRWVAYNNGAGGTRTPVPNSLPAASTCVSDNLILGVQGDHRQPSITLSHELSRWTSPNGTGHPNQPVKCQPYSNHRQIEADRVAYLGCHCILRFGSYKICTLDNAVHVRRDTPRQTGSNRSKPNQPQLSKSIGS